MNKVYHISRHFIGKSQLFFPKSPISQNKSEIEMPNRICASNSIEGCWKAISCCNDLTSEMKAIATSGYYFFVYSFDGSNFKKSNVFDAEKTGEVISLGYEKGVFEYAFYVKKENISNDDFSVVESSTNDEAISAYNEWQKDDLYKIEELIEKMEW